MISQQLIMQCDVYAVCYLHIKQIAISQERRATWKNYEWSSFIHFMYTLTQTILKSHLVPRLSYTKFQYVLYTSVGMATKCDVIMS